MDFFVRQKPFLVVEIKPSLSLTKDVFSSKLLFLQQQYKSACDSIKRDELMVGEFASGSLFSLNLNKKLIGIIYKLTNSSEAEWVYLNTYRIKDFNINSYILGEINESCYLIDSNLMYERIDLFLFKLVKAKILDSSSWFKLGQLKKISQSVGFSVFNDSSYYGFQGYSSVKSLDSFQKFEDNLKKIKIDLFNFMEKPLNLDIFSPIFWKFLKISERVKNYKQINNVFLVNQNKYEYMRTNKDFQRLPQDQNLSLIYGLEKISNFESLHTALFEFELINDEELKKTFKFVFSFFLSQSGYIFDKDNPEYLGKDFYEKFMWSVKWLDLILFMCKNNLDIIDISNDKIRKNMENACFISLSILLDERVIDHMISLHMSSVLFVVDIVSQIKKTPIYSRVYSLYVDKYLKNLPS